MEPIKVKEDNNIADILTKHLDEATMARYMEDLGLECLSGRSAVVPQLNTMQRGRSGVDTWPYEGS